AVILLAFGMAMLLLPSVAAQTVLRGPWTVQSSARVSDSGEKISEPGYSAPGWYPTSAPKTVFAVLVENGVYRNPDYGLKLPKFPVVEYNIGSHCANQELRANSPYAVPWGYRKEFDLPATDRGKQVWMQF